MVVRTFVFVLSSLTTLQSAAHVQREAERNLDALEAGQGLIRREQSQPQQRRPIHIPLTALTGARGDEVAQAAIAQARTASATAAKAAAVAAASSPSHVAAPSAPAADADVMARRPAVGHGDVPARRPAVGQADVLARSAAAPARGSATTSSASVAQQSREAPTASGQQREGAVKAAVAAHGDAATWTEETYAASVLSEAKLEAENKELRRELEEMMALRALEKENARLRQKLEAAPKETKPQSQQPPAKKQPLTAVSAQRAQTAGHGSAAEASRASNSKKGSDSHHRRQDSLGGNPDLNASAASEKLDDITDKITDQADEAMQKTSESVEDDPPSKMTAEDLSDQNGDAARDMVDDLTDKITEQAEENMQKTSESIEDDTIQEKAAKAMASADDGGGEIPEQMQAQNGKSNCQIHPGKDIQGGPDTEEVAPTKEATADDIRHCCNNCALEAPTCKGFTVKHGVCHLRTSATLSDAPSGVKAVSGTMQPVAPAKEDNVDVDEIKEDIAERAEDKEEEQEDAAEDAEDIAQNAEDKAQDSVIKEQQEEIDELKKAIEAKSTPPAPAPAPPPPSEKGHRHDAIDDAEGGGSQGHRHDAMDNPGHEEERHDSLGSITVKKITSTSTTVTVTTVTTTTVTVTSTLTDLVAAQEAQAAQAEEEIAEKVAAEVSSRFKNATLQFDLVNLDFDKLTTDMIAAIKLEVTQQMEGYAQTAADRITVTVKSAPMKPGATIRHVNVYVQARVDTKEMEEKLETPAMTKKMSEEMLEHIARVQNIQDAVTSE
eukprot:TRINITY_DN3107_c0_g1_i1.p1 TRINITY_DN3107_c0_g1~~TRINITY_DN3107_c0_g1_i1.p1  ORF type:complete len:780 (+),score=239.55 TRINITY_DN3107_c0_g1_i1:92-2431(+)